MNQTTTVLFVHLTATMTLFGIIWFVQVVHYPLFGLVGGEGFETYERAHQRWTSAVVGPPMLAEALTGAWLVWDRPSGVPSTLVIAGLALLVAIWCSTAFVQVPLHQRLRSGFDAEAHRRLVRSNWLRTAAWSARAGLVLAMVWSAGV